jgi:hypothetical protein
MNGVEAIEAYAAYRDALANEFRPAFNAEFHQLWIAGTPIEEARKILKRRGRMQFRRRKYYMSLEKAQHVVAFALRDAAARILRHRIDPETAAMVRVLQERANKVLRLGEPLD